MELPGAFVTPNFILCCGNFEGRFVSDSLAVTNSVPKQPGPGRQRRDRSGLCTSIGDVELTNHDRVPMHFSVQFHCDGTCGALQFNRHQLAVWIG